MAAYIRECIRKDPPSFVCDKPNIPKRVYETIPDLERGIVRQRKPTSLRSPSAAPGALIHTPKKIDCQIAYICSCIVIITCLLKGLKIKW